VITTTVGSTPGQYGANVVGARSRSYVDVMRGVTLGGRTFVRRGGDVEITIEIDRAAGPNRSGSVPVPAKIDLISGPVAGPSVDRDLFVAPETVVLPAAAGK
jgi:hypothetical protein